MSRIARYIFLTILTVISEFSFAKYISISAAVPMFTFCLVILVSLNEKNKESATIFGVLTGVFYDICSGHGFGTYTVIFGMVAWETAGLCDSILSSKFIFNIINTFLMTIFAECIYFLLHIIEIGAGVFWQSFMSVIIPTSVYNTVVSAIFYVPVKKLLAERR